MDNSVLFFSCLSGRVTAVARGKQMANEEGVYTFKVNLFIIMPTFTKCTELVLVCFMKRSMVIYRYIIPVLWFFIHLFTRPFVNHPNANTAPQVNRTYSIHVIQLQVVS